MRKRARSARGEPGGPGFCAPRCPRGHTPPDAMFPYSSVLASRAPHTRPNSRNRRSHIFDQFTVTRFSAYTHHCLTTAHTRLCAARSYRAWRTITPATIKIAEPCGLEDTCPELLVQSCTHPSSLWTLRTSTHKVVKHNFNDTMFESRQMFVKDISSSLLLAETRPSPGGGGRE